MIRKWMNWLRKRWRSRCFSEQKQKNCTIDGSCCGASGRISLGEYYAVKCHKCPYFYMNYFLEVEKL